MRSKTILSVAAFIIAFGFSVFLASLFMTTPTQTIFVSSDYGTRPTSCFRQRYQSPEAREISALLRQDISNGRERDRNLYQLKVGARTPFGEENFDDFADVMEHYVESSSGLNANDLPPDFQAAWEKHMTVWQDYSNFLNNMKDIDVNSSEGILRLDNKYSNEINATWYEVLRVGKRYGASTY